MVVDKNGEIEVGRSEDSEEGGLMDEKLLFNNSGLRSAVLDGENDSDASDSRHLLSGKSTMASIEESFWFNDFPSPVLISLPIAPSSFK